MDTKKLRQKILDLAIRGKLVPQDPNDEPASVLLERIKAEKERLIKEGKIKRSKKTAKTSDTPHYENVPFEVPKGWVWTTIEEICSKIGSGSTPKGSNYSVKGIPFFRSQNVYNDRLVYDDIKYISEEVHQKMKGTEVLANDLLLNITGGSLGRCAVVPADFNCGNVSQHVCIMRSVLVEPEYFHALVLSSYFAKSMKITGSGREGLPKYNLEQMGFPLPPLTEQQRIVTKIEHWFALLGQIEKGKLDLQNIIKQTKSKVLDIAIHGKLVPQDPNEEPAIELLKRINPDFTPCDNGQYGKRPFEIPNSWCWSRLGDINNIARGGSPRPIKDYLTDDKNGINWIKIGDTTREGKYIDSVKEKIRPEGMKKSRFVHKGDFLLTNSMSFGRPYILNVDGCIHDGWLVISPIGEVYTSDFLYHLLSSSFAFEQFTNVASGGVVTNLNSDKVADTIFPVPPLAEQQRIVAKIEKLFEQLDYIENSLEA